MVVRTVIYSVGDELSQYRKAVGIQQEEGQCSIVYVFFNKVFIVRLIIVLFKILKSAQVWYCISLAPALRRCR